MPGAATLFFVLSKIFGFFAQPTNLLVVAGLVGVVLLPTRLVRAGRRLVTVTLVLLALIAWSPISRIAIGVLEERFPAWDAAAGAPDGIIILGGSIDGRRSNIRQSVVLTGATERLTSAVELARRYPHARLIFSGGSGSLAFQDAKEAPFARRLLVDLGVPPERIEIEDRSRNTLENAVRTKQIANPKPGERWLLVTSGFHMPRSIGVFRKAGFPVEAYPVDWQTAGPQDRSHPSGVASASFRRFDMAAHEWVGLLIYWLTGHTSELLPGPLPAGCDRATQAEGCRP